LPARAIGLRLDALGPPLRAYALPFGAAQGLLLLTGGVAGTPRFGHKFFAMLAGVPARALLQQYMLPAFAHRRQG
jgi:hypothetical protein